MTIEQRIAELEKIVGDFSIVAADDLARGRPAELPNGDYPIAYRLHQLGAAFNDIVAKVNRMWDAFQSGASPQPPSSVEVPVDGNITVREIGLRTATGAHRLMCTELDGGYSSNFNYDNVGWRPGSTHVNPRQGQIIERREQDNALSWNFAKSDLKPNPNTAEENPANDYDNAPGKSFVIRGLDEGANHRSHVQLGSQKPGVGWEYAFIPKGGDPNKPAIVQLRGDERGVFIVNPDGSERKL